MDISLLIEPTSKEHSISVAPASTGATRVCTTAPSLTCVSTSSAYSAIQPISNASMPGRCVLPSRSKLGQDVRFQGRRQPRPQELPGSNESPPYQTPIPKEVPSKKQPKWSTEEDRLVSGLRDEGMKWDDIAKRLPVSTPQLSSARNYRTPGLLNPLILRCRL
jgi:hypothetical protein